MLLKIIQFIMIWLWENSEGTSCCFNLSLMGSASPTCHGSTSAVQWMRGHGLQTTETLRQRNPSVIVPRMWACVRVEDETRGPSQRRKEMEVRQCKTHRESHRSREIKCAAKKSDGQKSIENSSGATSTCHSLLCLQASCRNKSSFHRGVWSSVVLSAAITNLHTDNRAYRIHL